MSSSFLFFYFQDILTNFSNNFDPYRILSSSATSPISLLLKQPINHKSIYCFSREASSLCLEAQTYSHSFLKLLNSPAQHLSDIISSFHHLVEKYNILSDLTLFTLRKFQNFYLTLVQTPHRGSRDE